MGVLTSIFEKRFHPGQEPPNWFTSMLYGWSESASGVNVTPETSLQSSTVFACIRAIAETIASLPLNVYQRTGARSRELARAHYLFELLKYQANPETSSFTWRETMLGHVNGWGNAYSEIQIDGRGRVVNLWQLRPDRMEAIKRENGELVYYYRLPHAVGGGLSRIRGEFMLHIKGLGSNGLVGYSPIQLHRQAIGLSMAAEEFGARFFKQGARPGVVLMNETTLSEPAYKRLKDSFNEAYSGLSNAHRAAILEEGTTLKEVGIPNDQAQFLETRNYQDIDIARIFRVPPHKVGILERATFSNIEHQAIEFVVDTIRPWLVRTEQEYRMKLFLPRERGTYFAEHLIDALLRGDFQTRTQGYATGRQNGWLSANDVRELENMNPVEGGDEYHVPLNMIPASQAASFGGQNDARYVSRNNAHIDTRTVEQRALQTAIARQRIAAAQRGVFQDTFKRILRREVNDVLNAARRFAGQNNYGEFSLWLEEFYSEHKEFTQRQSRAVYQAYAEMVAVSVGDELGSDGEMTPELETFMEEYIAAFAARQVGSSQGQIRTVWLDAVEAGEDPLAALEERFTSWEESRPQQTAFWESIQANNALAKAMYVAAAVVTLRWVAVGDSCPYCQSLNGRVIGINQNFIQAGEAFEPEGADGPLITNVNVGHAPAHPGCDCMVTAGL